MCVCVCVCVCMCVCFLLLRVWLIYGVQEKNSVNYKSFVFILNLRYLKAALFSVANFQEAGARDPFPCETLRHATITFH